MAQQGRTASYQREAEGGDVGGHVGARFVDDGDNADRDAHLLDGQTAVKIHGEYVRVSAEICDLTDFSVHADKDELFDWLRSTTSTPRNVFVVHGELDASKALHDRIERELGWTAVIPSLGERISLRRRDATAP